MKITNCKVNHLENPLGYWISKPVFSWIVEGVEVKEARIIIYRGQITASGGFSGRYPYLIADTGWDVLDSLGEVVNIELQPRCIYIWQVQVRAQTGERLESAFQTFETGKRDESWQAKWITCEGDEPRLPVFGKTFSLVKGKQVERARLYICGLGLYEAYLNEKKVGNEYLTPGCNAYDRWLQAQTYDITRQLLEENQVSVILGDGWYKGRFDFESSKAAIYGDSWKLLAEIHIWYTDGSEQVVGTDESWMVSRSNLIFSGIYDGEQRDDTLIPLSLEQAQICIDTSPLVQDRLSIPVLEQERFPVKVLHTPKGELVLDVGQNMAGMFTLRVKEPVGTKVHLQFGEVLQDSNFYRDNLRTAKAEYVYTSDGKEHVLRPIFTFYGYRYVKIEGITDFKPEDFKAFAIYSGVAMKGKVITGHEKVNQLISNTLWGMKSNFVGNPTDCPQRDERMGWTGDTQVFSETACYLADTYTFYQKYLYDCAQEQKKFNGMVPDVIPAFLCKKGSSVWGDVTCIIPWNLYLYYGDKTILEEHYESMTAWLAYIAGVDGNNHGWREVFHYGDWLALDSPYRGSAQTRGGTDEGFIADVFYRKSALITAKTARILGKNQEAERYEALAEQILQGIVEEYFSPNGRCCIHTQTAALLTLQEQLHDRERAKNTLKTLLENNENKLSTGFVGTPLLCEGLIKAGMEKEAFQILLNEEYPGWLYEVNLGATTIWERWNSLDETGHISSTGMNSLNHYAYGAIVGWIWKDVVGLRCSEEEPGFRRVRIAPHVNWKIKKVDAEYPSPAGTYKISWEALDLHHISLKIVVPSGCSAKVELPLCDVNAVCAVEKQNPLFAHVEENHCIVSAGSYGITYKTKKPIAESMSINDKLRKLMADAEVKALLRRELPQVDNLMSYTGDYPLRETLRNLSYEEAFIEMLGKKIAAII
ncbi:MAG: family 78 glycoside hydrolase catalytic domain [Lachnospiraceae bacterium]|nr:family 78 glycoside hydrolase catalytic domain [Lachnospiraceae bacterium]